MKVSIIKNKGMKEIITRHSLEDVTLLITKGWREKSVRNLCTTLEKVEWFLT